MSYVRETAVIRTKRKELFVASLVLPLLGTLIVLAAAIALLLLGANMAALWTYIFSLFFPLAATGALVHLFATNWRERSVGVRADEDGLAFDGRLVLKRSDIRFATTRRRGTKWYVRVERWLPAIEVEVDGEEDAFAFLTAMRLDPARSVARHWFGPDRRAWIEALELLVMWAICVGALYGFTRAFWLSYAIGFLPIVIRAIDNAHRVLVGADGVRIQRAFHRPRFIAYTNMSDVTVRDGRIAIALVTGETIRMAHRAETKLNRWLHGDDRRDATSFVDRINERRKAAAEPAAAVALTARRERSVDDWIKRVRVVADDHATFRDAAVPAEQLWMTVEDSRAPATARAGAAVALRAKLDDAGRARLRAIADSCAAPKLRVALETLSTTDDDARLVQALDELDDTREEARIRSRA
jgi:hypothetical protein